MAESSANFQERDGVWRVVNAGLATNTYILRAEAAAECVLIDPGMATAAIDEALATVARRPVAILCTHAHFDHIASAAQLQRATGCPVFLHEADRRTAQAANLLMMAMRVPGRVELPTFTFIDGDAGAIEAGGLKIQFQRVPGHTPGSCLFALDDMLLTGDTLFTQGIDASKFHGGSLHTLRASIELLYARYPDEATVLPGHGRPQTLGWVKANNHPVQEFLAAAGEVA
jgi:hydroxyacylglutathione hydrolase